MLNQSFMKSKMITSQFQLSLKSIKQEYPLVLMLEFNSQGGTNILFYQFEISMYVSLVCATTKSKTLQINFSSYIQCQSIFCGISDIHADFIGDSNIHSIVCYYTTLSFEYYCNVDVCISFYLFIFLSLCIAGQSVHILFFEVQP